MKKLPQDKASVFCKYSRPTIGHIEKGRIEIPMERIRHILASYGYHFSKFEELMKEEVLPHEIIESCTQKLISLPKDKFKLVQSVITNFLGGYMDLGKNILKRCKEKGITVTQLARLSGVK
jgi:transcriptional regulator with XRE-family HTH domain